MLTLNLNLIISIKLGMKQLLGVLVFSTPEN